MAVSAYSSMTGPNGQSDNIGGLTQRVYFAPIRDFDTIAALLSIEAATTMDELVEISDDHVFLTGKFFKKSYSTRDKGTLKGSSTGDRDGHGFAKEAMFFVPGSANEALAAARIMKNDQFIFLFEQADGTWIQLGSEQFPAEVKPEYNVEHNESGVRGMMFTVSSFGSGIQKYTGAIDIS